MKVWEGDFMSKLSGLPFDGSLLCRPGLDNVLSRSSGNGKKFPVKPESERPRRLFFVAHQGRTSKELQERTQQEVGLW